METRPDQNEKDKEYWFFLDKLYCKTQIMEKYSKWIKKQKNKYLQDIYNLHSNNMNFVQFSRYWL